MKLRGYMFALIGLVLIPLALVAALAIWLVHRDARRDMHQALLERVRAMGVAMDREVETTIAALRALAAASDLDAGDLRRFYEQARRTKEDHPRWLTIRLIDPAGRQVLNLLRPLGSPPLPAALDTELFRRTLRTLEPEVSDLFVGTPSQRWTIAVNVPVLRDGQLRYIVSAVMTPDGLAAVLAAAQIPAGSDGAIIDRSGLVVASTGDHGRVGKPARPDQTAVAREEAEGVLAGQTLDGREAYTAFSRARSPFTVVITVPAAQLEAPFRRSLWLVSGTAVAVLGIAFALSLVAARMFGRRMDGLSRALAAFGRGEPGPELPSFWVAEFRSMAQSLAEAMALLRARTAALQESERRYRATFEQNPAGMYLTREDGRILDANVACARLLGVGGPAELVGRSAADFYADPKDCQQLDERVKQDGSAVNVEVPFRRRDGRSIWVLLNVVRAAGVPEAAYDTTLIDVTEHRAAEELRTIARLANAAAHEINSPLTVVIGRLAMLAEDPGLGDRAREGIAQARAAAERIKEIVLDMRQLTRVELFQHTSPTLPPMIDIRRSAGGPGGPGAEPAGPLP